MSSAPGLFAELKRRSVFKVGAAYLVVAWLAIQAASILLPTFEAPAWTMRVFVLFMFIGFPIALVMAWVFEIGGGGVRVEGGGGEDLKFYGLIGAIAALAFGWYHFGQPAVRAPEAVDADARSIAVLPFVNMSGDPENEYFSDGISEEVLNQLARLPDLKVAARTSSFAFKGEKKEIRDIARELGVRLVLEGSVRKQSGKVRITAQLIDAEGGFHLWSEVYDRDLEDVFGIQTEIARAIAAQLKLTLEPGATPPGGAAAGAADAGVDAEAYDLYLRSLSLLPRRDFRELGQAIALLERSVERAPTFARGHATLAIALDLMALYDPDASSGALRERATDAALRALALDPTLAEAYGALGLVAQNLGRDATALLLLDRALALNPSFAQGHTWRGLTLRAFGRWQESERESWVAHELDPRSQNIYTNLIWHLAAEGRYDESRALAERKLALEPTSPSTHAELAVLDLIAGRHRDAHAHLLQSIVDDPDARRLADDLLAALEGRTAKPPVIAAVATRLRTVFRPETNPYSIVVVTPAALLALGARDAALADIERAAQDEGGRLRTRGILRIALVSAPVGDLRCDPRFQAAIAKAGAVDGLAKTMCAK